MRGDATYPAANVQRRASRYIRLDVRGSLKRLPGAEIVLPGLADLEAGRKTVNASAVQIAASRLRDLGLDAPGVEGEPPAAHRLYRQLSAELGDDAHSRYNAILARVASFAGAAERARRG
jgi:hypothetical protein